MSRTHGVAENACDGIVERLSIPRSMPPVNSNICSIFVHAGAGYHSEANERIHLAACKDACKVAMAMLREGGCALDAVEIAIRLLEDSEITNAGFGSNLNTDGVVEMDALIMEGNGMSGAVGAATSIKNPISLARSILEHSKRELPLRRVPPVFLVSDGTTEFARQHHIPVVDNARLVSAGAKMRWNKWKEVLDADSHARKLTSDRVVDRILKRDNGDNVTDTVGAIAIDARGRIAAGSSSGGIGMKHPGRIGPAALVGVGTWAKTSPSGKVVACTTSGTGEHMSHTLIASRCVDRIYEADDEIQAMRDGFEKDFIGAQAVREAPLVPVLGVLGVKMEDVGKGSKSIQLVYGHTSDSMALGYCFAGQKPTCIMSRGRAPRLVIAGRRVKV